MSLDLEEEHVWLHTIPYEPLQTNQRGSLNANVAERHP